MADSRWAQTILRIDGGGRGLRNVTADIGRVVDDSAVVTGVCHVFIQHTSASLLIQENADPDVLHDLGEWFRRMVPDGDPAYHHRAEGPDDMSAHIRTALTQTSLTIPVVDGRLALGTWQGIYVFEHRNGRFERRLVVTVNGTEQRGYR